MLPLYKDLNISAFSNVLDDLTTSYKIYWFAGIFEEVTIGNRKITFRRIVTRMISKSWYSILEYRLNFGVMDQLSKTVDYIHSRFSISKDVNVNKLLEFFERVKDQDLESELSWFYKYVPFRLLAPFYKKYLVGLTDYEKNGRINALSHENPISLYRINNIDKVIYVNEQWFEYLNINQSIISGWLESRLIKFLQSKNPNVPAIPFKLNPPYKRNLTKVKKLWTHILSIQPVNDIYTDQPLIQSNYEQYGSLSIDHFIPWSFVLHDQIWNLTPTFQRLNSSKSDHLPDYDQFIDRFCELQYFLFKTAIKISKKEVEDYYYINPQLFVNGLKNPEKSEFCKSIKNTIYPLYKIASNQGYQIWNRSIERQ